MSPLAEIETSGSCATVSVGGLMPQKYFPSLGVTTKLEVPQVNEGIEVL